MNIILKKSNQMKRIVFFMLLALISWNAHSQIFSIRGIVSDAAGEPLIGVNVVEDGTLNGTITDADGAFNLRISDSNAALKVTYIGYEGLTVDVAGRSQ